MLRAAAVFGGVAVISLTSCGSFAPDGRQASLTSSSVHASAETNGFTSTSDEAVSTFSLDVDTGSYTLMRKSVSLGQLPAPSSVRVEEFLNYFRYEQTVEALAPPTVENPLAFSMEAGPSPFGPGLTLLRIGVKAFEVPLEARKPVNLVFLIDTSGSMSDRLALVKYALGQLVQKLQPTDTLGIVIYAGEQRTLLEPTPVDDKTKITNAIASLTAGGGTAGGAGIQSAYAMAERAFRTDGVNRVVLCTDGDFNIGLTGDALTQLIVSSRSKGIFLTTLGFGMGNYKDSTLEQLADKGNGNYGYIDSPNEAVRMLGENLVSTLEVVAKDAKLQVAFEPTEVKSYRLIGYDNRRLANEDFTNDQVDSGDVGAGHTVTALYELELRPDATGAKLAEIRARYKHADGEESTEHVFTLTRAAIRADLQSTSNDFRFSAAVAEFGEILSGAPQSQGRRFDDIVELAASADASSAERQELVTLIKTAKLLSPR